MSTMYVNNIAPLEGTTINVASGSTLVQPGSVIQFVSDNIAGSGASTSSTDWVDTAMTISITPKQSNSVLYVSVSSAVGPDVGGNCRIDLRLIDVGTSTVIADRRYIGKDNPSASEHERIAYHLQGTYDINDTSSRTFKVQVRRANGESGESGNIYTNWYINSLHNISVMEIAQ